MTMWAQRDGVAILMDVLRRGGLPRDMVRVELPDGWTRHKRPVVTVSDDGTPTTGRGWTAQQVRVTVRARDRPTAGALMRQIDAYLVSPNVRNWAYSIRPATGILVANDSRMGGAVGSATYRLATNRSVI